VADSIDENLFAYGTLMFPEVWHLVTLGAPFSAEPGSLQRYRIRRVKGASFPGIFYTGDSYDSVGGIVLKGVSAGTLRRLDAYEDSFYERRIEFIEGNRCQVYIVPEKSKQVLSNDIWRSEEFAETQLPQFLQALRG